MSKRAMYIVGVMLLVFVFILFNLLMFADKMPNEVNEIQLLQDQQQTETQEF